ncbi:MAG TPA: T9SS type A sorting domain-containing protein [Chitinophagaceae bacterium]|nr:T9SS type A sorting domain-containing protein [Chitinophagaceae bacterium]
MKTYLYTHAHAVALQQPNIFRKALFLLFSTLISFAVLAQTGSGDYMGDHVPGSNPGPGGSSGAKKLDFRNGSLVSGTAGANGAIYKFPNIGDNMDARVKIAGRSNALVSLVNIDVTDMGHDKAFQPKVMYNGGTTPAGNSEWWMEFEISFVNKNTTTLADPFDSEVSAIDIDGNGHLIKENVHFYGLKSYTIETGSMLQITNIFEMLGTVLPVNTLVGKKFDGPTVNFLNIDTNGTAVMSTVLYDNKNTMRIRVGGASSGASGASDRMYSLYFKSFNYHAGLDFTLPLVLKNFNASLNNKKVNLDWVTGHEKDLSHFVVERSTNGIDYTDAGVVFAAGNSTAVQQYNFSEVLNTGSKGVVYYRLKMMDSQKRYQYSPVRIIRMGDAATQVTVQAYPNPVINELRITVPATWQNQQVSYEVYNMNGNLVKRITNGNASQTETLNVKELGAGSYVVKAYTKDEAASQRIVKR